MVTPALDRERLLRDLEAAFYVAAPVWTGPSAFDRGVLHGMARAFRLVSSAIEDGDYDVPDDHYERVRHTLRAHLMLRHEVVGTAEPMLDEVHRALHEVADA